MAIVTVRPNGTDYASPEVVNVGGAASLHAAMSDDSDTTYGRYEVSSEELFRTTSTFLLGSYTLAAGERVKRVRPRLRALNGTTGTGSGQLEVRVVSGGYIGSKWNLGIGAYASDGDDPVDRSGPWVTGGSLADPSQQTALDDLQYVAAHQSSNDRVVRIHELYLDLDVWERAVAPTVGIVEASAGTVSTSDVPTVTAYTTARNDGAPALWSVQVRVFRDAVYLAGGFDPTDETDVEWEHDDVSAGSVSLDSGNPDEIQVDEPLTNSDTYRAYVRYGKNDVSGQTLWSEWGYAEFTLSLTLPSDPTIAVAVDQIEGRQTIAVTTAALTHDTLAAIRVERSDDDGATWATIRGGYIVADPDTGGALAGGTVYTLHDYDAPRDTAVAYRARVTEGLTASGTTLTSGWDTTAAVSHPNDGRWWLYDVHRWTGVLAGARISVGPEVEIRSDVGVFYPLGRAGEAVVVSGASHGDDGSYTLRATGTDECAAVDAIARYTGTVLVKSPFGDQKYLRWVSRSRTLLGTPAEPRHTWTLEYAEIGADIDEDGA